MREIKLKVPKEVLEFLEWYVRREKLKAGTGLEDYILSAVSGNVCSDVDISAENPCMVVDDVIIPEKLRLGFEKILKY